MTSTHGPMACFTKLIDGVSPAKCTLTPALVIVAKGLEEKICHLITIHHQGAVQHLERLVPQIETALRCNAV